MAHKVFLAHPKDCADRETHRLKLNEYLNGKMPDVQVVLGSEDFEANFARYGGWEGWAASVATGMEYEGSLLVPRFTAIVVCPDLTLGKATADIVRLATSAGKPTYYFDGVGDLRGVKGVSRTSEFNFKSGWVLY